MPKIAHALFAIVLVTATGCTTGMLHTAMLQDPMVVEGISVTEVKWSTKDDRDFIHLKIDNLSEQTILIGAEPVLWIDAHGNERTATCMTDLQWNNNLEGKTEAIKIPPKSRQVVVVPAPFKEPGMMTLALGKSLQWLEDDQSTRAFGHNFVLPLERPVNIANSVWQRLPDNLHIGVFVNSDGF